MGGSTANRVQLLGYKNVYFPVKPGFEGLVNTIMKVLADIGKSAYGEDVQLSEDVSSLWNPKRKNKIK